MTKKTNAPLETEIVEEGFKAPILKDIKYPVSNVDIESLLKEYTEIPKIDPESDEAPNQYQYVLAGHKRFVKARTSIEKVRKELKAPAWDYGKKVDEIAKEFQTKINPTEHLLASARNVVEDHEKRKIEEAERIEEERRLKILEEIARIKNVPLSVFQFSSEAIKNEIGNLQLPDPEKFQEFLDDAISAYSTTMTQLEQAFETKQKAEQAELIEAENRKRLEAEEAERQEAQRVEREAFEVEKAELRRQQNAMAETMRVQQEAIDRQNAEIEAEALAREQEAQRAESEKQKAIEAERREKERQEIEKKKEAERVEKEKADIEFREQRIAETLEAMNKYTDNGLMLNEIIRGAIPNVRWVV